MSGERVLLLPGGFCYSNVLYRYLVEQSNGDDWDFVYADYYGASDNLIRCGEDMDDYYNEFMKLTSIVKPDLIIGHSFSANVLLYYLGRRVPREKLIIYAPTFHESHEDPLLRNITRYASWMFTNRLALSFFRMFIDTLVSSYLVEGRESPLYDEVRDMIRSMFNRETGKLIRMQLKAFFKYIREPLIDEWRRIRLYRDRVRLVYGEYDEVFKKLSMDDRFEDQEDIIHVIRGAGHMAVMEKPEEFIKIMEEF